MFAYYESTYDPEFESYYTLLQEYFFEVSVVRVLKYATCSISHLKTIIFVIRVQINSRFDR